MCHCNIHELLANLDLLWRDVLLRTCSCVKFRDIIGLTFNIVETDLILCIGGTVIQVLELHLVEPFVAKENFIRTHICMNNILLVDQLQQVNNFQTNID